MEGDEEAVANVRGQRSNLTGDTNVADNFYEYFGICFAGKAFVKFIVPLSLVHEIIKPLAVRYFSHTRYV